MSQPPILDYRNTNDPQPAPIRPKGRLLIARGLRMIATAIIFLGGAIILAGGNRDVETTGGLIMAIAGVVFCYQLFVGA